MTSNREAITCHGLRMILDEVAPGDRVPDCAGLRDLLSGLEYLLPEVLAAEHRWWRYEGFDGILPVVARKVSPREIEVNGLCILISDQSVTPIQVRLGIASEADEIASLECKVGEPGDGAGGLRREPFDHHRIAKDLASVGDRASQIDWVYTAGMAPRA